MSKWIKKILIMTLVILITFIPNINEAQSTTNEQSTSPLPMPERVNRILNDPKLSGAIAGISIRSADTGKILFEHNGNVRLRPASNLKLLTAAAALDTLGADFRFQTQVVTDGKIDGSVLNGNIYLKGMGDPTLLNQDIIGFAKQLTNMGIHKITGNVVVDDSWYDQVRYSKDLPWSDEGEYYGSQVSALTISPNKDYDTGTIMIEISPANKIGGQARIRVIPENNYVQINNKIKTSGQEDKANMTISRKHGTNDITLKGTIPFKSRICKEWVSIWEPTGFVFELFKEALIKNNIEIKKNQPLLKGTIPSDSKVLFVKNSMPLSKILIPFMKLSNNGHAEILVKEMGRQVYGKGTWDSGLKVIQKSVENLGVKSNTLLLRDGSGISPINLIPANEITKLLFKIQSRQWFTSYKSSLPVAGKSGKMVGGTLRNRLKETVAADHVFAKTGSITSVHTLSGYVTTNQDKTIIFSILLNNLVNDSVKDIEDKIVKELLKND